MWICLEETTMFEAGTIFFTLYVLAAVYIMYLMLREG